MLRGSPAGLFLCFLKVFFYFKHNLCVVISPAIQQISRRALLSSRGSPIALQAIPLKSTSQPINYEVLPPVPRYSSAKHRGKAERDKAIDRIIGADLHTSTLAEPNSPPSDASNGEGATSPPLYPNDNAPLSIPKDSIVIKVSDDIHNESK